MESGSFGALARATWLGLLADKVVVALERIRQGPMAAVPEESRVALEEAAAFLDLALDESSRTLVRQVTRRGLRSEQAYHQAIRAARTTRESGRERPGAGGEEPADLLLRKVRDALRQMQKGESTNEAEQGLVQAFFLALSDIATAEYHRMSLRSVVHWRGAT